MGVGLLGTVLFAKQSLCRRRPPCAVDSSRLFTASADQTVRMWELQTGKELFQFKQQEPCRGVSLSVGEGMLAFTTDAFMGTQPMIHIVKLEQDVTQQSAKPVISIEAPKGRITRVFWTELNRCLITSHDGGYLRKWDSEVSSTTQQPKIHVMRWQTRSICQRGYRAKGIGHQGGCSCARGSCYSCWESEQAKGSTGR